MRIEPNCCDARYGWPRVFFPQAIHSLPQIGWYSSIHHLKRPDIILSFHRPECLFMITWTESLVISNWSRDCEAEWPCQTYQPFGTYLIRCVDAYLLRWQTRAFRVRVSGGVMGWLNSYMNHVQWLWISWKYDYHSLDCLLQNKTLVLPASEVCLLVIHPKFSTSWPNATHPQSTLLTLWRIIQHNPLV